MLRHMLSELSSISGYIKRQLISWFTLLSLWHLEVQACAALLWHVMLGLVRNNFQDFMSEQMKQVFSSTATHISLVDISSSRLDVC